MTSLPLADAGRTAPLRALGEARARVVEHLAAHPRATAGSLADALGTSATAVRKHLDRLRDDGLVADEAPAPDGPGRPAVRWSLTDEGHQLLPDGHAELANEVLSFLSDTHGRDGMRAFLRWRMDRQADALARDVAGGALEERLEHLADALSAAGFAARVEPTDDGGFALVQTHCTVQGVAAEHPALCAYEAATFRRVLGDVQVSRRSTIAGGDHACVCQVAAAPGAEPAPDPHSHSPRHEDSAR